MFPGGDIMQPRLIIAGFAALIAVTPAAAQTSQQTPQQNKPDTNCPTADTSSPPGKTTGSSGNAMDIGKSAIVPHGSDHAQSAAPTVQQDGKPMQARPDCPPDQAKK
jgi:hypothetical protein